MVGHQMSNLTPSPQRVVVFVGGFEPGFRARGVRFAL